MALLLNSTVVAGVVVFEGVAFPEDQGWLPNPFCEPDRRLEDGWFFQHVELCDDFPPPGGQQESFTRPLEEFIGEQDFFIEWRMHTDGDSAEIPGVAPASLVAGGSFGVTYHFTIASDKVRFIQDNFLPIIWVDVSPDIPHTYRLELHGDEAFIWYVDGEVVHAGIPEGSMPLIGSVLQWRAKSWFLESTTIWDYIRYGTIPIDGGGDFDSDGAVGNADLYFFQECLSDPDAGSWAGCAWADMDFSGSVDCDDWFLFLAAWTDPADPPTNPECAVLGDLNNDGSVNAFDLAILLGSWGPCPDPPADCPADLDGDGNVNAFDLALLLGSWG